MGSTLVGLHTSTSFGSSERFPGFFPAHRCLSRWARGVEVGRDRLSELLGLNSHEYWNNGLSGSKTSPVCTEHGWPFAWHPRLGPRKPTAGPIQTPLQVSVHRSRGMTRVRMNLWGGVAGDSAIFNGLRQIVNRKCKCSTGTGISPFSLGRIPPQDRAMTRPEGNHK